MTCGIKNMVAKAIMLTTGFAAMSVTVSCVHEWPDDNRTVKVRLTVSHDTDWTEYEYNAGYSGRSAASATEAQYVFRVYRKGDTTSPVKRQTFTRNDLSLADFEVELELPSGEWDIYAWQDFVPEDDVPFHDCSDFSRISYTEPYRGGTDWRDAFEGRTSVSVPSTIEAGASVSGTISLERPLAKYVFIATDFNEFFSDMVKKEEAAHDTAGDDALSASAAGALDGFGVKLRYPLYMPGVYDMFGQRVADSLTGISYDAVITPVGNGEAVIAFDYVFMNHHDSGVQVQLSLKSPSGNVTGLTGTLSVPLLRGRITYVRGRFLTASVGSGLDIDFSFSDDINIKV